MKLKIASVLALTALTSCLMKKTEKTNGAGQMASVGVDVSAGSLGLSQGQEISAWRLTLSCLPVGKTAEIDRVAYQRNFGLDGVSNDTSAITVNRTNHGCASVFSDIKIKDLDIAGAEISLLDKYSVGGVIAAVDPESLQDGGKGISVSGSDVVLSNASPKIVFRIQRSLTNTAVSVAAGSVSVSVQMGSSLPHPALDASGGSDGKIAFQYNAACPEGQSYSLTVGGISIDATQAYTPTAAATTLVMSCTVVAVPADGILASVSSYTQTVTFAQ